MWVFNAIAILVLGILGIFIFPVLLYSLLYILSFVVWFLGGALLAVMVGTFIGAILGIVLTAAGAPRSVIESILSQNTS
ncbi:MAG: hypothetical protein ACRCU2_19680, partial [Planktothrix sp.]